MEKLFSRFLAIAFLIVCLGVIISFVYVLITPEWAFGTFIKIVFMAFVPIVLIGILSLIRTLLKISGH